MFYNKAKKNICFYTCVSNKSYPVIFQGKGVSSLTSSLPVYIVLLELIAWTKLGPSLDPAKSLLYNW